MCSIYMRLCVQDARRMCFCMYSYVCIFVYICTWVFMCVGVFGVNDVYAYMSVYVCTWVFVHICARVCRGLGVHVCAVRVACMHMCMRLCGCLCVCVCACIRVCPQCVCLCGCSRVSVCASTRACVCWWPRFLRSESPRVPMPRRTQSSAHPRTKRGGPAPAGPLCPPQLSRLRGGRPLPGALRGPAEPAGRPCTRRAGLAHHPRRSGKRPTLLSGRKGNSPWRSRARTACSVLIISPHGARSPSEPRGDPDAVGVRGSECAKQPAEHAPRRSPFPRPSSQRHLRPVGKLPVH